MAALYGLKTVQKFFPGVTEIKDSKRDVTIQVTPNDCRQEGRKKHTQCAMALAGKRDLQADGMIVSISTAYVIKGKRATRFMVRSRVGREIVSFDRGAGFTPGVYALHAPAQGQKMGERSKRKWNYDRNSGAAAEAKKSPKTKRVKRATQGIRAVLGSRIDA